MKNILRFIVGATITLLVAVSCQPRYVILPIPSDPAGEEATITDINSVAELRSFLEKSGNGKANVKSLVIDPTVENLPITIKGSKEIGGSIQIGKATPGNTSLSINLLADTEEQANELSAVFYVPSGAEMNLSNLNASITEEAVSKVSALVEVDTGNITLSNVSISVPDTVNTAEFSTIKATENTTSANISISSSENISVFIPEDNNDESLKNEIEESGTEVATPYDVYSLEDIQNNLAEYGKARLTADLSITSEVFNLTPDTTEFENLLLDLNGKKLSIVITSEEVSSSVLTNLEIKDGNLEVNNNSNNLAFSSISIASNAHLTFTNVDYHASHTGIFLSEKGNAAFTAVDSEIISDGGYGVGKKTKNSPITSYIALSNTIVRTDDPSGTAGILFNSKGTLNITAGSEIEGSQQAVVARGGNITISDSKLFCNGGFVVSDETQYRYTTDWGQGNDVPYATLVVGNRSDSDAYDYPTTCTVSNTEITMKINEGNSKATRVYISSDDDNTVTLNIDNSELATNIETGKHYWGLKTYVNKKQMPVDESGNPSDSITK